MNLRQIEAFRAIMNEGSVTQASVALGVTQPAVSCLIGNLEDSLGFLLFTRHRGRLQPTSEALAFLDDAERLLASYNRTLRAARDIRDLKSGSLRIAVLPAMSSNFIPKVIAGFVRRRPQVTISLQTRSSIQIKEWVSAQLFDIGIAELPADNPSIDCEPLRVECLFAMPEGHPLAARERIAPEDLLGEKLLVPSPEHAVHYQLRAAFEAKGIPWEPYMEGHLFAPNCRLVAEGVGISIVDPFTANDFAGQGLAFRPFETRIPYDIGLLFPSLRPKSRLAVEFAENTKTALRSLLASSQ